MQVHMVHIASQLHAVRAIRHCAFTVQKPTTSRPMPCIRTFLLPGLCGAMAPLKASLPWSRISTRLRGGSTWIHSTFGEEITCKKAIGTPWRWKKWMAYGAQNASFVRVVCRNAWKRGRRSLGGMNHLIEETGSLFVEEGVWLRLCREVALPALS